MKKIYLLTSLVMSLLLGSCSAMLRYLFFDVRKPKIETTQTLNRYLLKNNIDTSANYVLTDSTFATLAQLDSRYFMTLRVYDGAFHRLKPTDSLVMNCFGSIEGALRYLETPCNWIQDTVSEHNDAWRYFSDIRTFYYTKPDSTAPQQTDYIVVVFWSKFTGEYSLPYLRSTEKYCTHKPRIRLLKINMDLRSDMDPALTQSRVHSKTAR